MVLPKEEVRRVAHLARIKMSEQELDKYSKELSRIFDWIEQLNEVDTNGVKSLFSIESHELFMRKDEAISVNTRDQVLSNCPENGRPKYGYFVVPKVVE